jgi:hypothetical protein
MTKLNFQVPPSISIFIYQLHLSICQKQLSTRVLDGIRMALLSTKMAIALLRLYTSNGPSSAESSRAYPGTTLDQGLESSKSPTKYTLPP